MNKILIVDDEEISLLMTQHILSTEYKTVCASSGEEAIKVFNVEKPDLVLSDLRMPGMTGYELQSTLQNMTNEQIPFMFMTADLDEELESKGFANGAMDFIRKPLRADVLLKRVGNIIQTVEKINGLKTAAFTDPMTGCLNKTSSAERISEMCRHRQGVLIIVDLDSFKLVNDIYGHDMGDKILIRFSEILHSVVREDDVVGRIGGDEFIIYCQNVSNEKVIEQKSVYINEHIMESAKAFMGKDMNIPLGASLGCVFVPEEGRDYTDLYKKADKALLSVKQNGKHGYSFFKSETSVQVEQKKVSEGMKHVVQILSERNQTPGALELNFEHFRTVFRHLNRIVNNYKKNVRLLLFTLNSKDGADYDENGVTDKFLEVLRSSLRQSDVVTKISQNQCLAMILKADSHEINIVTERILKNWNDQEKDFDCDIKLEIEKIREN